MSGPQAGTPADADRELEHWKQEAGKRREGCRWHSRRYRLSYERWDSRALWVSVLGGAATVIVGATLLTDAAKDLRLVAVILGLLGIVAGLLQVLEKAVGPHKRADDYRKGELAYDRMRAHYKLFIDTWRDPATARDEYRRLREEDERLPSEVPRPVERWTHKAVVEEGAPDRP
jgi:hypothetical protein